MRRDAALAVAVATGLSLLAACSGDDEPDRSGPPAAVEQAVEVQRLLDVDPATLPLLRTNLPRRVPDEGAVLPSVLDDPPGPAALTYHPREAQASGPQGWASEDILFFGRDGRWSRLRMEDLGLPESAWQADTYGAGDLSPDGRWWAGSSELGVILLDLTTGRWRLLTVDGDMTQGGALWIPGEDAFVVMTYAGAKQLGIRVSVPDGRLTRMPFVPGQVGFEPDGTPISLRNHSGEGTQLVEWVGDQPVERFDLPVAGPGRGRMPFGVLPTEGRFVTSASRRTDNYDTNTVTVVDSETGAVQAILRYQYSKVPGEGYPGWLDPETFLIKTRTHVLAWRPDERQMYRVMEVREPPPDQYWTVRIPASSAVGVTTTTPDP